MRDKTYMHSSEPTMIKRENELIKLQREILDGEGDPLIPIAIFLSIDHKAGLYSIHPDKDDSMFNFQDSSGNEGWEFYGELITEAALLGRKRLENGRNPMDPEHTTD